MAIRKKRYFTGQFPSIFISAEQSDNLFRPKAVNLMAPETGKNWGYFRNYYKKKLNKDML